MGARHPAAGGTAVLGPGGGQGSTERQNVHLHLCALCPQLKSKATINERVKPISFSSTNAHRGALCSVPGWGRGAPDAALREANVTIKKERECVSIYPGLTEDVLCATSGSSGAPDEVGAMGPRGGVGCVPCCPQAGLCPLKAPSPPARGCSSLFIL